MCLDCADVRDRRKRRLLTKQAFSPEEERAFRWLLGEYQDALQPLESDIESWLAQASEADLESLGSIRSQLEARTGVYTSDFEHVFREGGERGALAGREIAARQHQLDIAFDVVPERTLEQIDDWVETAAGSTLETITEDATRWLRGAHEEGLGIDDIATQLNDELFEGRLEDYVAERAARTATVSTSNTGTHSAIEDSSAVAERWLASLDDRERESHGEAHGQVVAVGNSFEVGNSYGAHPGDPSLPIDEIANCRCSVTPVFADDLTETQLERILAGERLWIDI